MRICRCLRHGHSAISCILMFWMGEITSPMLNAFTISRELRHVSKAAQKVFVLVSPLFTGGRMQTGCSGASGEFVGHPFTIRLCQDMGSTQPCWLSMGSQ